MFEVIGRSGQLYQWDSNRKIRVIEPHDCSISKRIINGITVLTADSGMKLINGETFGSAVQLGVHDSADNRRERTNAEAEALS